MPNFVLGRSVSAVPLTTLLTIQLRDTASNGVPANCVITDSGGTTLNLSLDSTGFYSANVLLVPGTITITANASGYANGPWIATAVFNAGVSVSVSNFTPTPIKTVSSAGRNDFGVYSSGVSAGLRDKYKWPFAANSAWNTPIGANAVYASAGFSFASRDGYITRLIEEEEYLFLDPAAPLTTIQYSDAAWTGANRCSPNGSSGQFPISVRMPSNYTVPNDGGNNVAAHVDGDVVKHHQPLARCTPGANGTSFVTFTDVNIKTSTGENGGHGGSNLSGLGGTIRYGELTNAVANNLSYLSHALKMNWQAKYFYYWGGGGGNQYRWPATTADGYANGTTYGGTNNQVKPGSLIALLPSFNVAGLLTPLGKIIAGTLIRFGAYLTDDTTWNSCAMSLEKGPGGNVVDEVAALFSGLSWRQEPDVPFDKQNWYKDFETMAAQFQVITNNSAVNVGGGGAPILSTPTAPAFGN